MTTSPTGTDAWTTKRLLRWMLDRFEQAGMDQPRIIAELLLAHVLGCDRLRLYMDADRPTTEPERNRLRDLVRRALQHEPVQYLTGSAPFYTMDIAVEPVTLIPRPSTETVVDAASTALRDAGAAEPRLLDIGTGTGCIAIALLRQFPSLTAVVTDLDVAVLDLARRNAERYGVAGRLTCRCGSLFEPVAGETFDIITSNPPYIADTEWSDVEPNVRDHEPARALRAGPDGLDVIRPLIEQAGDHLATPHGRLILEFGHAQRDAIESWVRAQAALGEPALLRDHESYWRVVSVGRA